jgi:hypothetical protein
MNDSTKLREQFESAGCAGALALIDFLDRERKAGRVVTKIGSGTVDFNGVIEKMRAESHTSDEIGLAILRLPALHFGRADGKRTPFDDLKVFADRLAELIPKEKIDFDLFCADLAAPGGEDGKADFKVIRGKLILYRDVH